jgi:hypothetical protein
MNIHYYVTLFLRRSVNCLTIGPYAIWFLHGVLVRKKGSYENIIFAE